MSGKVEGGIVVKAARSAVERRGYDSGVFHGACEAEMGFQITPLALCANLHASMPPTGCTEGEDEGREEKRATGEDRGAAMME